MCFALVVDIVCTYESEWLLSIVSGCIESTVCRNTQLRVTAENSLILSLRTKQMNNRCDVPSGLFLEGSMRAVWSKCGPACPYTARFHTGSETEGIFRLSGMASEINAYKDRLNRGLGRAWP